jgi:hypothetical protein
MSPDCSILCGDEGGKNRTAERFRFFTVAHHAYLVTSAQKGRKRSPAPCAENETAQKHKRAKRAKKRENKRLTISKLKKSKIFLKVLDKG